MFKKIKKLILAIMVISIIASIIAVPTFARALFSAWMEWANDMNVRAVVELTADHGVQGNAKAYCEVVTWNDTWSIATDSSVDDHPAYGSFAYVEYPIEIFPAARIFAQYARDPG